MCVRGRERECVFTRQRQETDRDRRRTKGRVTSPPDSCFSSFCFMLGPSSSLVATLSSGFLTYLRAVSALCVCVFQHVCVSLRNSSHEELL